MAAFLVTTFELLILPVILSIRTQIILRKMVKTMEVGLLLNRSIFFSAHGGLNYCRDKNNVYLLEAGAVTIIEKIKQIFNILLIPSA